MKFENQDSLYKSDILDSLKGVFRFLKIFQKWHSNGLYDIIGLFNLENESF